MDARIDAERLWQRHVEMAKLGGTPKGGVCRLALTDEDNEAHVLLESWATRRGFSVALDDMGNMFIRRAGTDPDAAPVASGSHTDTQPTGGRFDGIYGVLAAFEALEAIDDAGIATRRPIEAIVWNNEEGSRFHPGCMGSAVHAGVSGLEEMLGRTDPAGVTMGEAVKGLKTAMPKAEHRPLESPLAAFVEAHIEQGPQLENTGNVIGIVTGMQGNRRFEVEVVGEEAHSGTTPLAVRKDAFKAAIRMARALEDHFHDPEDVLRFTIGKFQVHPGALTVVPGRVDFSIDFRHPDAATLQRLGDGIAGVCAEHAGPCTVEVRETSGSGPIDFAGPVPEAIEASVARRGYPAMKIYSGAGHDSRHMVHLCPTGMLFVPCEKGISHNEAENADPKDLAAGAQVITDVLLDLAERL